MAYSTAGKQENSHDNIHENATAEKTADKQENPQHHKKFKINNTQLIIAVGGFCGVLGSLITMKIWPS